MLNSASLSLLSTKSWYLSLDSLKGRGFVIWYRLSSLLSCAAYASGTQTEFMRHDASARLLNVVVAIRFRAPQTFWWDDSTVAMWKKRSQFSRDNRVGIMIFGWSYVSRGERCKQRFDLHPARPSSTATNQWIYDGSVKQVDLKVNWEQRENNRIQNRSVRVGWI